LIFCRLSLPPRILLDILHKIHLHGPEIEDSSFFELVVMVGSPPLVRDESSDSKDDEVGPCHDTFSRGARRSSFRRCCGGDLSSHQNLGSGGQIHLDFYV
jgi:hypothetical protein